MLKRILVFGFFFTTGWYTGFAQNRVEVPASNYNPDHLFSPHFFPDEFKRNSPMGEPGPDYWQNRADYTIEASLDDQNNRIRAKVEIQYTNNSPYDLDYLWLQLDQNLFSRQSRGQLRMPADARSRYGDARSDFDGGFKIENLMDDAVKPLDYVVTDTRMQIRLSRPLKAKGGKMRFSISYQFVLPAYGADRCGIQPTKDGPIFLVAQWYPRLCVFDATEGWNTDPYLGPGEFYLEYGDFDVRINAPAQQVVVAGGELLNPAEVFTTDELKQYQKALESDVPVIISQSARKTRQEAGQKTWHFKLQNARDFAWSSSAAFILDGARVVLPSGKKVLAQSAYPDEVKSKEEWGRSTEYIQGSIYNYSRRWFEYPYPVAVNVAGNIGGMEYPGIVFCGMMARGSGLFGVTDHEFGHTWFPMIVGSNERRYGWMDEGFNTFINSLADDDFNQGEYKSPPTNMEELAAILFNDYAEPIYRTPDALQEGSIGYSLYYKPAIGLELLRNQILGPERFDYAFKTYIRQWAYKHPTPWDFFRCMNNAAGENLNWFWKSWFLEKLPLDQSVFRVEEEAARGKTLLVTLINMEGMAMPVTLEYVTKSGKKNRLHYPVEIWNNTPYFTVRIPETETIRSIELDPDKSLPDINRQNNSWKAN